MLQVLFDPLANLELEDTIEYYNLESPGLGERFKTEIKLGIRRISEYPEAWTKENNDIRRYLLHKFPYKIIYSIEKNYIYVIAVAHCHRKPNYWIERAK